MNNAATTNVFKSYTAKLASTGRSVRVINTGTGKKTGEPMVKIQEMYLLGYCGDHTPRADWRYGEAYWTKKSNLVG